jgi:hypothetical protein
MSARDFDARQVHHRSWTGWTGPADPLSDRPPVTLDGRLWPYGPPDAHEEHCRLWEGLVGCDCEWSAAEATP